MQNIIRFLFMQVINKCLLNLTKIYLEGKIHIQGILRECNVLVTETLFSPLATSHTPISILHDLLNIPLLDDEFTGINFQQYHK